MSNCLIFQICINMWINLINNIIFVLYVWGQNKNNRTYIHINVMVLEQPNKMFSI